MCVCVCVCDAYVDLPASKVQDAQVKMEKAQGAQGPLFLPRASLELKEATGTRKYPYGKSPFFMGKSTIKTINGNFQ